MTRYRKNTEKSLPREGRRKIHLGIMALFCFCAGFPAAGNLGCIPSAPGGAEQVVSSSREHPHDVAEQEEANDDMEERWGVRIESLRLAGEGNMIDFRFRILDPDRAAPLVDRVNKPSLLDEKRGIAAGVPSSAKLGPMRQTIRAGEKPKVDRVYFVMFSNPGKLIQKGDPVTVTIGDFYAEHLVVE